MSALDADQIALIDQRIRAAQRTTKAVGTCVSRDTTGQGAQVVFDGSTVAMPVWVAGSVYLEEGFRCALDRYGSQWVVTASAAHPSTMGMARAQVFGAGGSTSSASYVDQPDVAAWSFTKIYDLTWVRVRSEAGGFSNTSNSAVRYGVRLTPLDAGSTYTPVDVQLSVIYYTSPAHLSSSAETWLSNVPAGDYTVQARWKKTTGGAVFSGTDDLLTFTMFETVHPSAAIL